MQNQFPLFLSYNQVRDLPIVTKYQKIFDELDLSNISDETVARKLYKKLKRLYKSKKGMIIIADKAYDVRDFYTFTEYLKTETGSGLKNDAL